MTWKKRFQSKCCPHPNFHEWWWKEAQSAKCFPVQAWVISSSFRTCLKKPSMVADVRSRLREAGDWWTHEADFPSYLVKLLHSGYNWETVSQKIRWRVCRGMTAKFVLQPLPHIYSMHTHMHMQTKKPYLLIQVWWICSMKFLDNVFLNYENMF